MKSTAGSVLRRLLAAVAFSAAPLFAGELTLPDDGKYRYYPLGAMPIGPDVQIAYAKSLSSFHLNELYDPKRPNRLFEFHVMLAVMPGRKELRLGELLAIPTDRDAKTGEESKRATSETINTVI